MKNHGARTATALRLDLSPCPREGKHGARTSAMGCLPELQTRPPSSDMWFLLSSTWSVDHCQSLPPVVFATMRHFCGFELRSGTKVPVEVPEGSTFHLTGASFKAGDIGVGTRAVVTLSTNANPSPCAIATLVLGSVETVRLDLYVCSAHCAGLTLGLSAAVPNLLVELVGSLIDTPRHSCRHR